MGKNKNEKKSPAVKKVAPETPDTTDTGLINKGTNKSSTGKKDDLPVLKEKMR